MIRHTHVCPFTGYKIRTVFKSQGPRIAGQIRNRLIVKQGVGFTDEQRKVLAKAGLTLSPDELARVYASERVNTLLDVYVQFWGRIKGKYQRLKNYFRPVAPAHVKPNIAFDIEKYTDPVHAVDYFLCLLTGTYYASRLLAEQNQYRVIREQNESGISGESLEARLIHARHNAPDQRSHSVFIGDTEVKRNTSRVYLIKPRQVIDKNGNERTLSGQQSCCLIENIIRLPDKNHLITLRSCVIDAKPFPVFSSEIACNWRGIVRNTENK